MSVLVINAMAKYPLYITYSISPYDVSILLLIYHYCYDDNVEIPIDLFLTLITPTIQTLEFNPILQENMELYNLTKPILPFLDNLGTYFIENNQESLYLDLLSMLTAIEGLDTITQILKDLESECLVKNYRQARKLQNVSKCKKITRSSFLGIYIQRCITRYNIGNFDDKEQLWYNLQVYMENFRQSEVGKNIGNTLLPYHFQYIINDSRFDDGSDIIAYMKQAGKKLFSDQQKGTTIAHEHFQSLLNWEMFSLTKLHNSELTEVANIISNISLNDLTKFPSIYILKYLIALQKNYYQEALDSLHNYFDYMLTQNGDNYFHISLLGLGTFYSYFHNCKSAINAYKEATKVAREYKDTTILNLIMVRVVNFIEEHPEYATNFQVTINQVVRYLKSCSDYESSSVFEHAYKFESLLKMEHNDSSNEIMESSFKYMVIALQNFKDIKDMGSFSTFFAKLWRYFGYDSLASVYTSLTSSKPDKLDEMINNAFNNIGRNKGIVDDILTKINSPKLTHKQLMNIKLLQIKNLIANGDFQLAMGEIPLDTGDEYIDPYWKLNFDIEKSNILLSNGVGVRGIPNIMKMVDANYKIKNPLQSSNIFLLLLRVLIQMGKLEEAKRLLTSNILVAFQFKHIKFEIMNMGLP